MFYTLPYFTPVISKYNDTCCWFAVSQYEQNTNLIPLAFTGLKGFVQGIFWFHFEIKKKHMPL